MNRLLMTYTLLDGMKSQVTQSEKQPLCAEVLVENKRNMEGTLEDF